MNYKLKNKIINKVFQFRKELMLTVCLFLSSGFVCQTCTLNHKFFDDKHKGVDYHSVKRVAITTPRRSSCKTDPANTITCFPDSVKSDRGQKPCFVQLIYVVLSNLNPSHYRNK